jgi:hypothetical protein
VGQIRRHASDWFEVDVDRAKRRVIVRRRPPLFESAEHAADICAPVLDVLDGLDRRTHTLLLDVRQARGVSDPAYEAWYAPLRRQIVRGFARAAVLVGTASGALHARRLATGDKGADDALAVFDDPILAEQYLDR